MTSSSRRSGDDRGSLSFKLGSILDDGLPQVFSSLDHRTVCRHMLCLAASVANVGDSYAHISHNYSPLWATPLPINEVRVVYERSRATQKLNLSSGSGGGSPHRRKRGGHAAAAPEDEPPPAGFCLALLRHPPPLPSALLRRLGTKELSALGKIFYICDVSRHRVVSQRLHSAYLNIYHKIVLIAESRSMTGPNDVPSQDSQTMTFAPEQKRNLAHVHGKVTSPWRSQMTPCPPR
ncbi:hypothetical protein AAG570_003832 [Ranatra chinensis]|uniref:Uncharacterized protein n=1 Tax=Ranatra chinensis TaxID=642074 RepID=A0ABD0YEM2_9HEMI